MNKPGVHMPVTNFTLDELLEATKKQTEEIVNKAVDRLDERIDRLETRMDRRFDVMEFRMDRLEGKFDDLERRTDMYARTTLQAYEDLAAKLTASAKSN
jgi:hypothetical protein